MIVDINLRKSGHQASCHFTGSGTQWGGCTPKEEEEEEEEEIIILIRN